MSNITLSSNTTSISVNSSTNAITVSSTPSVITVGAAQTVSNTAIRAAIGNTFPIQYDVSTGIISSGVSNVFPILYDVSTGVISIDEDAIVDETVVDNGNKSGNITLDLNAGRLHKVTLNGDVTGITFANVVSGRSATVILTQDSLGGNELDTTTFTSNWTAWNFANQFTSLDNNPNAWNVLSVFYDGTNYYASLVVEQALQIQNSELANSNITVNGTTINLGSSGQISNLTGLDTGDLAEGSNQYFTNTRARNALSGGTGINYNSGTGVIALSDTDLISGVTAGSGLTGGGTSGNVTLNVGAGYGITVNADSIEVNNTDIQAQANSAITTYFGDNSNSPFIINGNLQVQGNIDYVNVEDLLVNDQSITLNYGNVLQDAFIYVDRTGLNNAHIKWNETSDQWEIYDGTSTYVIPRSTSDLAEGTNLYWTTDRGNTNSDAWLTTKTTDNLTEGTNLYWTTDRGNTNSDAWLTTKTTTDLAEGTNLYFSNTNLATSSTTHLPEGTNLYYTDARVEAYLSGNTSTINANTIQANAFIGGTFTGDGSDLADVRAESVEVTLKNADTVTIPKGYPVHATGYSGSGEVEVVLADAGNADLMPAHFIAQEELTSPGDTGRGILAGRIQNVDTSSFSVGDTIYVAVGGGYANVAPSTEANLIQNLGIVTRIDASNGGGEVMGAGRTAATPNLDNGKFFLGNASNKSATAVFTDEANTAFDARNLDSSPRKLIDNVWVKDFGITDNLGAGSPNYYFPNSSPGSVGKYLTSTGANQLDFADFSDDSNTAIADYLIDTGVQKKAHTVFVQDLALSPDAANAQLGFYMPNGQGTAGQVLKFDSSTQLTQAFLDTGNVTETSNLYYTDARVQSNTAADTGLVHTTGNETIGGEKTFSNTTFISENLKVGGDTTSANVTIEEFHDGSGGGLLRTVKGRGTNASRVYGKNGDAFFRFIGVGIDESLSLRTGGAYGFRQDDGNVELNVPTEHYFDNGSYQPLSVTGRKPNRLTSDVYTTEAFASKDFTAHVTEKIIIGNHDAGQLPITNANLSIGHSQVNETEGRSLVMWSSGNNIQNYGLFANFTDTGVGTLQGNAVIVAMVADARYKSELGTNGGTSSGWAGNTWKGNFLADGTAVTVNGSPTSDAANADGQTYYTKAVCELDWYYQNGTSLYALYTDAALTTPLTWGAGGLNANEPVAGVTDAFGANYGGWCDIQFTGNDFGKKIKSSEYTTTGSGTGAEFFVSKKGSTYVSVGSNYTSPVNYYSRRGYGPVPLATGSGFAVNDTVEIDGTLLGGQSNTNNLTFTIDSVDGSGGVTSVGNITGTGYTPTSSTWSFEKQYTSDTLSIKHNGTDKLSLTTTQTEFLSIPILPQYSNTSLPAATNPGGMIFVTNGNDKPAYSNGSAWLYVFDNSAVT